MRRGTNLKDTSKTKILAVVEEMGNKCTYGYPVTPVPSAGGMKLVVDQANIEKAEKTAKKEVLNFNYSEPNGNPDSEIKLNMMIKKTSWRDAQGNVSTYDMILGANKIELSELAKLTMTLAKMFKACRGELMTQLMVTPGIETLGIPFTGKFLYSSIVDGTQFRQTSEDLARVLTAKDMAGKGYTNGDERTSTMSSNIAKAEDAKAAAALFDTLGIVSLDRTIEFCEENIKTLETFVASNVVSGSVGTAAVKPVIYKTTSGSEFSQIGAPSSGTKSEVEKFLKI